MARLADPPTETVESLKRRFIRQNRELARHNSTQSVKIRSLEDEISRLLAANISLREENIQLRNEFDEARDQYHGNDVSVIKTQFEEKLKELLELTGSLGDNKRKPKRRRSHMPSPRRPPAHDRTLSEDLLDQEGRMPTIVEGKYYPRKTMDANDIRNLLQDTGSDSPLIASPPMPSPEQRRHSQKPPILEETQADSGLLFANLETRKKRRESQVHVDDFATLEQISANEIERSAASKEPDRSTIRAGAKRKLDVRNSSRLVGGTHQSQSSNSRLEGSDSNYEQQSPRKALAPKPVNTDPVLSPKKAKAGKKASFNPDLKEKQGERKTSMSRQPRANKPAEVIIPSESQESDVPTTVEVDPDSNVKVEPKTPGEFALFSPPSTFPTDERPEARDTPPPSDIKLGVGSLGDGSGSMRGSRRARVAVSYAEPSLNTKMRRPSKTLVDAVVKRPTSDNKVIDVDEIRPKPNDGVSCSGSDVPTSIRTVIIKKEDCDAKEWQPASSAAAQESHRSEPQSPLGERGETNRSGSSSGTTTSPPRVPSPPHAKVRSRRRSAMQSSLDISTLAQLPVEPPPTEPVATSIFDVPGTPELENGLSSASIPSSTSSTSSSRSKSTLPPPPPSARTTSTSTSNRRQTLGSSQSTSDLSSSSSSRVTNATASKLSRSSSTAALSSASSRPQSRNGNRPSDRESERSKDIDRPSGAAASRRRSMML